MNDQVGTQPAVDIKPPCCAACRHWEGPKETYARCTVLAGKNWRLADHAVFLLPFWAPPGKLLVPDMTTRTFTSEGKNCSAYISNVA